MKARGKEGLDKIGALVMSGKVGAILKELRGMADDAAYALFPKITDNKLSRKILEVADKWNRKKDGKPITEEQAKILIEEAEDGTEVDEILDLMEKVGVKSLGFDDLMKRLTTKAGNLLSDHWDDLSKEAKETITNVIEKTTGDGRKLSLSGTEILLDEYADKTEEALTKKILYFTTEHMETGIDNNAFKILRKEWDGWDDVKKDKVDEIIQKCSKSTKVLTEDDVNDILTSCDELSVDDMVKLIVGARKTIDDIIGNLKETTDGKGIARNFESSGGFEQTLKDFNSLNPVNIKDIQTKYGPGKTGLLRGGATAVARPDSKTGGATLEVRVSNSKIYKIRY